MRGSIPCHAANINQLINEIMEKLDLRDVAYDEGFGVVETTSERNGYPRNLRYVITGFDTFEQAEMLAEKYDLDIIEITKRNGNQLWARNGKQYEPFKLRADMFGDDYRFIHYRQYDSEAEFIHEEVDLAYFDSVLFDEIEDYVFCRKQIWENIEDLEENEAVVLRDGAYWDTIKVVCTQYTEDVTTHRIALINKPD